MRTKVEIIKLAILSVIMFFALLKSSQAFADDKAEYAFCEESFSFLFSKSSVKSVADELVAVNTCFTGSGQANLGGNSGPKLGASISSRWTGSAIRDISIKVDNNGMASTYTLRDIEANDFGKTVTAYDGKGGSLELRAIRNKGNNIRIKCFNCKIIEIVKALNALKQLQFIDLNALPKEKKTTLNFDAIPVEVVASILALEADVDMAQYLRSESVDVGGSAIKSTTISRTYVERYIFLDKSLKE